MSIRSGVHRDRTLKKYNYIGSGDNSFYTISTVMLWSFPHRTYGIIGWNLVRVIIITIALCDNVPETTQFLVKSENAWKFSAEIQKQRLA